jgi:ABC-type Fe3+-hydroxamate transport system substrate-binding protein
MIITSATQFKKPPQKIVSLVPSQTELLSYFGLDDEVIGITKFCIHPQQWFAGKTRVGGTKNINLDLIKSLQTDLIIANIEENVKEQIEKLALDFNVLVTDVNNLHGALEMIEDVGKITCKLHEATELITLIKKNFLQLPSTKIKINTAYLIWKDPYMTIGGDTFINDMMQYCGLKNIFENQSRYPEITIDDLAKSNCELILLSSEPYPFKQKHIDELRQSLPGKKIILADGEIFSWYGSRLLLAPQYFKKLREVINK